MLTLVMPIALAAMGLAVLLNFWRLVRGPTVVDRIVALDTLYINAIALLMLLSIQVGRDTYFEAALLIAMMGFVGTIALSKYLTRGDIIE